MVYNYYMLQINTKTNLYILGDIHGNLDAIYDFIDTYNITNSTIVSVGDFGYGFVDDQLSTLNYYLFKTGNSLLVNRGNHDCYWNHYYKFGYTEYSSLLEFIKFLPNYSTLLWNDKKILCIGGAVSIDRVLREDGISWWKDEAVEQRYPVTDLPNDIDIIISHTNPSSFIPLSLSASCYAYAKNDPHLIEDLIQEREYLQWVFEYIKPKIYFHGHFHHSERYYIDDCKVISLGIDELYQVV